MSIDTKAVFLDRDGTLIHDEGYLSDPNKVKLLPGVQESLRLLKESHWLIFLFTNQSGIGRGYYTEQDARACNDKMIRDLQLIPSIFTEICMAPERPDQKPIYRKPSPRFILECLGKFHLEKKNCWMVGDRATDIFAGENAGIHAALLQPNASISTNTFPNLLAWVRFVLQ